MDPYQSLTFDNRPRVAQFLDGGPITDGMANLGAALLNAGPAAAQIRHQNQLESLQQLWHDQERQRQTQQDAMAQLWHDQGMQRQDRQDAQSATMQAAQIDNLKADNARQTAGMLGTGINNAAARGIDAVKALGALWHNGRGSATPNASTGWHVDADTKTWFRSNADGTTEIYDPSNRTRTIVDRTGNPVGGNTAAPQAPVSPVAPAEDPSFWSMRRSGQEGAKTIGDLFGGVVDGWDPNRLERMTPEQLGITPVGSATAQPNAPVAIDNGMRAWHQLAGQNPNEFKQQIMAIKASDPKRYAAISAALRSLDSGK